MCAVACSVYFFEVVQSTIKSIDGRPIKGHAREIIVRDAKYFKLRKEKYKMDFNIAQSTSEATGVSITSVKIILKEDIIDPREDPTFSTPK
jgi:hypothetical protein